MVGMYHTIIVRPESSGQFLAVVLGLPEIRATAATEQEAVERVRQLLEEWLASAKLVQVKVSSPPSQMAPDLVQRRIDPSDPVEQMYLEELARFRREDLERTLREDEEAWPGSSSTPTT